MKANWRDTVHFPPGGETEFTFITKDNREPLRSLKAAAIALFNHKVRLLGYWEFFEFRKQAPVVKKKTKKRKASAASSKGVNSKQLPQRTRRTRANGSRTCRPVVVSDADDDDVTTEHEKEIEASSGAEVSV